MTINGDQVRCDRFSAADEGPMTVLALPWLPVLMVPMAVRLKGTAATEPTKPHGGR
jgi:hypothetical protein